MQNRTPIPRDQRPPLSDFAPVPRKPRHDGWTPERQRAFIEALADTGSVQTACRMVNMSTEGAYYLRRQPGAEGFRRAWEAALDFGVQRLKDEAFERAMNGQLVPVFVAGKLMGFRRKKNDRLLMFCLRHYGQDDNGRRTTVNYFSSRATAGAAAPSGSPQLRSNTRSSARDAAARPATAEGVSTDVTDSLRDVPALAVAEASTTTIQTVTSRPGQSNTLARLEADDRRAHLINHFEPADLDEQARAEIQRVLEACARRRRALDPDRQNDASDRFDVQTIDPETGFIRLAPDDIRFAGELESGVTFDEFIPFNQGELGWQGMGEGGENAEIERVLAEMEAKRLEGAKALPLPAAEDPPVSAGQGAPEAAPAPPATRSRGSKRPRCRARARSR